jgi:hypothetical protein
VDGSEVERIANAYGVYTLSDAGKELIYSTWGSNHTPGLVSQSITTGERQTFIAERGLFITDVLAHGDAVAFIGNYVPQMVNTRTHAVHIFNNTVRVGTSLAWSLDGQRLAVVETTPERESVVMVLNREGAILARYTLPPVATASRVGWVDLRYEFTNSR